MDYTKLASEESLQKTVSALKTNGIDAVVVENGEEAKKKVLEMIPEKAEVMTMTSETLRTTGITQELDESGKYDSVKHKLKQLNRETDNNEMQRLGTAHEWAIGSVHAVSEEGHVFIASNTGSQLPAYAYGADHVIWVVGTQKIVANMDIAMKRIYDHVLPLEAERARIAYGGGGSNVSKMLIVNKEVKPNRITVVFVKEQLGF